MLVLLIFLLLEPALGIKADSSSALQSLFDRYYQWRLKNAPEMATYLNVHTYDDKLDQYGVAHMDFTKAKVDDFIKSLKQIDYQTLSRQQQVNYDVLNDTLATVSDAFQWRLYSGLNPINFLEGEQVDPGFTLQITPFNTKKDYENFIARLDSSPQQIDDIITLMREAIRLTRTNHAVSMTKVPGQIGQMISSSASDFIFYKPFKTDLDNTSISDTDKNILRSRGLVSSIKYIAELRKLKDFIENEYIPHTRGSYGVGGLENGALYYRSCLKWHTTTDLSPERVHVIGLSEIARISKEMIQIMRKQNFNGTIAEYFTMLSKEPRFHFKTGDEVVAKYKDIVYNRVYPALPKVFKNLPKYKIKVTKMANDGHPAQYQVGSSDGSRQAELQANVHRPNETDSFSMVGLALHESVPGHHLQFAKMQTSNLPSFRKEDIMGARYMVPYTFQGYSAYQKGWALYAEFLGEELGLYIDDYELMGRYSNEIVRACRLVVDTGMHYFGWSRDRALAFFRRYSAWSGGNLENEIDRYITWPGQSCAYKIGEMKIRELRTKAENELGSMFDIRDFHEVVLTAGLMPLSLLESVVNHWISDTLTSSGHHSSIKPTNTAGHEHSTRATKSPNKQSSTGPVYTFTGQLPLIPNIG